MTSDEAPQEMTIGLPIGEAKELAPSGQLLRITDEEGVVIAVAPLYIIGDPVKVLRLFANGISSLLRDGQIAGGLIQTMSIACWPEVLAMSPEQAGTCAITIDAPRKPSPIVTAAELPQNGHHAPNREARRHPREMP
jgi:hypothetical protein